MRPVAAIAVAVVMILQAASVRAEVDGRQLLRSLEQAEAFNAGRPEAERYRAGFFNGYLSGVLDTLEGRSVCLRVCRCEVEDRVAAYLRAHPAELDRPAAGWLVKLLEEAYPCPKER